MLIPKIAYFVTWEIPYFGDLLKKGYFGGQKRVKNAQKRGQKSSPTDPPKSWSALLQEKGFLGCFGGGWGGSPFPAPRDAKTPPKVAHTGGGPVCTPPGGGDRVAKTGFSDPPLKSAFCLFGVYPGSRCPAGRYGSSAGSHAIIIEDDSCAI